MAPDFDPNTDTGIVVRPARAVDAFSLLQMMRALAAVHGAPATAGMDQVTEDCFGPQRWLTVLVAEDANGRLLGFASLTPLAQFSAGARGIDLHQMHVTPLGRGMGVADLLMVAVRDEAQRHGAVYLRLTASAEGLERRGLYRPRPEALAEAV